MQAILANGPTRPTDWNAVNWRQVNRRVRNLRQRIFRASQAGDWKTVTRLQKLMLRSYSNRLLAVRRVTQVNQGKDTPGVDQILVKSAKARGRLVDDLATDRPWRANPAKRVYIPKVSGKRRPLGIPTIRDRALQAVVKNALEPAWEARFEATSYGFRPGRSAHDAIQRVCCLARTDGARHWVLDADIEGAFDHVSHDFILQAIGTFPARELIRQWLKAGVWEAGRLHATEEGTPQGGVLSPLLLNIALHGMEPALGVSYTRSGKLRTPTQGWKHLPLIGIPVRYADDIVVFCETEDQAYQAKTVLAGWLAERGLMLSGEKTRIVHLRQGFDFLGFNVRHYRVRTTARGWKVLIKPSQEAVARIRKRVRDEWNSLRGANALAVIRRLNPIVRGWANYYRTQVASGTFADLDDYMYWLGKRWTRHTHPHKGGRWRAQRYYGRFNPKRADHWVFGDKRSGRYLLKFGWHTIVRHTIVTGRYSPDDPNLREYWRERQTSGARMATESTQTIAQQQDYRCPSCHDFLFNGEDVQKDHIVPRAAGGSDSYRNLQLLHLYCHQQKHHRKA